ncbi:hypothetical protein, partial [Staphylococcus aureus]
QYIIKIVRQSIKKLITNGLMRKRISKYKENKAIYMVQLIMMGIIKIIGCVRKEIINHHIRLLYLTQIIM